MNDVKKKKKKMLWRQFLGMAFMMLIGIVCGIAMVMYVEKRSSDAPLSELLLSLVGLFLCMYAAFFFHIIVHEAGHLVFGLMTGYGFSSFRIFSLMWQKENGKIRFRRLSIAGTGGQCLMTPPDMKDGKLPVVLYNLGGSLLNCIVSALFLIAFMLWPEVPFLSPLLFMTAFIGFVTALMNGIPMRLGTVDNDGYNALVLSRNREAVEAFWVQLKTNDLSSRGVRMKDMPAEWFAVPTDEAMKNSMVASRGVLACGRLMDEGRFEEADALMAHMLETDNGLIGLHASLMTCDRIYLELIRENRGEAVQAMLSGEQKKFMKTMKRYPSVLRCEYALALLSDKDAAKAEKIRAEFDRTAKTYPFPQEIASERELMKLAEDKASPQA